jgi:tetratricopeptide (TPR) repeat protein
MTRGRCRLAGAAGLAALLAMGAARLAHAGEGIDPAEQLAAAAAGTNPAPGTARGEDEPAELSALRNDAITAYNAQNYQRAATLAARWLERAQADGRTGREVAALSFIVGHSRYELHQKETGRYAGDYRADVVRPIEESLRILQDDPAFKNMLLGNAWYTFWSENGRQDADAEARGHWHLLKSILIRREEVQNVTRTAPEYDLFARHALFYLERCLDYARSSEHADLYLTRLRSVAPWGFGTAYDARFWQIHDLTYFDDGHMRAAALWQRGLDLMRDPKADADGTLAVFAQAADITRRNRDRAEVFRQMSDFAATLDTPARRVQAADYAKQAYELDPANGEIRRQYGTALHLLSYAAYASGRFDDARARAQDAVTFEWDGMEVAFFDLSRAAAEMGQETEALTHGERAFRMARAHLEGTSLQPFAQNYVNILRQFGQDGLAARVQAENAGLGVR